MRPPVPESADRARFRRITLAFGLREQRGDPSCWCGCSRVPRMFAHSSALDVGTPETCAGSYGPVRDRSATGFCRGCDPERRIRSFSLCTPSGALRTRRRMRRCKPYHAQQGGVLVIAAYKTVGDDLVKTDRSRSRSPLTRFSGRSLSPSWRASRRCFCLPGGGCSK